MEIDIRKCSKADSDEIFNQIANLHKQEISQGSIAKWGLRAVSELYRFVAAHSRSFIFIAQAEGRVIGFIAGSESTRSLYIDFLKSNFIKNLILFLPEVLSPRRFYKAVETLMYPSRRKSAHEVPEPEILNFCVDHHTQGAGMGGRLFGALLAEFQKRGIQKLGIITGSNQKSAQRFYEKRGAQRLGEAELHSGVKSVTYTFLIPQRSEGQS